MTELGNVLDDVRVLQQRVEKLEKVVQALVRVVDARGSTDALTQIMEGLGLWPKKRRTRARR